MIFRGGLPITIYGYNFDSIYGYVGNPVLPWRVYPYIGIWVGNVARGPEFFKVVSLQYVQILSAKY